MSFKPTTCDMVASTAMFHHWVVFLNSLTYGNVPSLGWETQSSPVLPMCLGHSRGVYTTYLHPTSAMRRYATLRKATSKRCATSPSVETKHNRVLSYLRQKQDDCTGPVLANLPSSGASRFSLCCLSKNLPTSFSSSYSSFNSSLAVLLAFPLSCSFEQRRQARSLALARRF